MGDCIDERIDRRHRFFITGNGQIDDGADHGPSQQSPQYLPM